MTAPAQANNTPELDFAPGGKAAYRAKVLVDVIPHGADCALGCSVTQIFNNAVQLFKGENDNCIRVIPIFTDQIGLIAHLELAFGIQTGQLVLQIFDYKRDGPVPRRLQACPEKQFFGCKGPEFGWR